MGVLICCSQLFLKILDVHSAVELCVTLQRQESRSRVPRAFRLADQASDIADVQVMDLIDETRRVPSTSPAASMFHDVSARYHPMTTIVFIIATARRLGVSLFPPQAICAACDAPMDPCSDHTLSFCSSGPVSRDHRHGSVMYVLSDAIHDANLRSERWKCGLLLDTLERPNHDWPVDL
jgi:hypothetical protein